MLTIIRSKIDQETREKVAEDLKGYIKVVVDVKRKILSAGAGLDLETNEMDFDSMINLRPTQNKSREMLDPNIRQQIESITRSLLV